MLIQFGSYEGLAIGSEVRRFITLYQDGTFQRGSVVALDGDEAHVDFGDWIEALPTNTLAWCISSEVMGDEYYRTLEVGRVIKDYRQSKF